MFVSDNTTTQFIILVKDFRNRVIELYEEEKNDGIEGYTRFKFKCIQNENKTKEKAYCQAKEMREVWRWTESVNRQEDKGKKMKEME